MKDPKRLIIHCGLHKTGTTALQVALKGQQENGPAADFYYPRSGMRWGGHHNLAWQLTRDRRFDAARGTLDDLKNEIAGLPDIVVLSSEDFESVLHKPEHIARLNELASASGRRLEIHFFVRHQVDYFESLYLEILRHGCGIEAGLIAEQVIETGQLRWREFVFQFEYDRLLESLLKVLDRDQLDIRIYDERARADIVSAFMQAVGLRSDIKDNSRGAERIHDRLTTLDALSGFIVNRGEREPTRREMRLLKGACKQTGGKRFTLDPELRRAIVERFQSGNLRFLQDLDLDADNLQPGIQDDNGLDLTRVFSLETALILGNTSERRLPRPSRDRQLINELVRYWTGEN